MLRMNLTAAIPLLATRTLQQQSGQAMLSTSAYNIIWLLEHTQCFHPHLSLSVRGRILTCCICFSFWTSEVQRPFYVSFILLLAAGLNQTPFLVANKHFWTFSTILQNRKCFSLGFFQSGWVTCLWIARAPPHSLQLASTCVLRLGTRRGTPILSGLLVWRPMLPEGPLQQFCYFAGTGLSTDVSGSRTPPNLWKVQYELSSRGILQYSFSSGTRIVADEHKTAVFGKLCCPRIRERLAVVWRASVG